MVRRIVPAHQYESKSNSKMYLDVYVHLGKKNFAFEIIYLPRILRFWPTRCTGNIVLKCQYTFIVPAPEDREARVRPVNGEEKWQKRSWSRFASM